jgi:hypothetical protein
MSGAKELREIGEGLGCVCGMPPGDPRDGCVCLPLEKGLKAYLFRKAPTRMTLEMRVWCYQEIARVHGADWTTATHYDDQDLARSVLDHWVLYAKQEGLME